MNTKERLLEQAQRLFLEKGYKKTTLRSIAESAGVNSGLFSYYFKNKEQLAKEVYNHLMQERVQEVYTHVSTYIDPIEKMYGFYLALDLKIQEIKGFYPFYCDLLWADTGAIDSQSFTFQFMEDIIQSYHLTISPQEKKNYALITKGAERALALYTPQEENLDFLKKRNELLVLTLVLLLGVEKEIILEAIQHVNSTY